MFISSLVPDIIILTETWLKPYTLTSELGLHDFTVFQCDRAHTGDVSRAGGVLLGIRKYHRSKPIEVDTESESLFMPLNVANVNFLIAATYINSDTNESSFNSFYSKLENVNQRFPSHKVITYEDFNLSYMEF